MVYLWSAANVWRHNVGTTNVSEVAAPGGGSIAGTWAVLATPDHNTPTTRTIWIRTATEVYRQDTGLLTTAEVEASGGQSIGSPAAAAGERTLAVVRNSLAEGASLSDESSPVPLGWFGQGVNSAAWMPKGFDGAPFVSSIAHTGVVQAPGGDSALAGYESALLVVASDPVIFADSFESGTPDEWSFHTN
jgi:hypothetical protein